MKMMHDRLNSANILEAVLEALKGRYKYIKPLKPGGFSKVYLVQHKFLGECVLKIMDYGYIMDTLERETSKDSMGEFEEIKKRFINEAQLYKKISHPNIVQIYDIDIIEFEDRNKKIEIPYLIMNYIKGKSLEEIIAHKRPLNFETAIKISGNILSALEALHQLKVIHRDIKPGNIMIEEKKGKAVLIDFGLAKDKLRESTLTIYGTIMGTLAYMPPEQFESPQNLDLTLTADIYSFGVVLYEMLSGEVPFKGGDNNVFAKMMVAHSHFSIPDVREKNPFLPAGIETVIFKAMAKNPGDRYKSAKEFLNALKAIEKTPKEIVKKKKVEKESIKRYPIKEAPTEEFKAHHKRPETRKPLFSLLVRKPLLYLLVIIAALLAILIGGFIVINPLKGPGKEQLEQYRKYVNSAYEFMENGEYEKSNDYLEKAKEIKNSDVVRQLSEALSKKRREKMNQDFEALQEFLKKEVSKNEKIARCREFLNQHKNVPQNNETKSMASVTKKLISQLQNQIKADDEQYRLLIDYVNKYIAVGDIEEAKNYLSKVKQLKDSEEIKELSAKIVKAQIEKIKEDFEEFKESLKGKASPGSKIDAVDMFKDKLERFPETDETKLIASELRKIRVQLEKENPFGEKINIKAKRIFENDKGFWEVDYGDGIVMVYIPPGEFTMGSNDGSDDEKPPHTVYLDGYWIGKTEVTVGQYMEFVNETNSHYPEWLEKGSRYNIETENKDHYKKLGSALTGNNYPIVGISWNDAISYLNWLSNKTGLRFKLPTEAQWEKAARGTDGRKFPWGNHAPYYNGEYYSNYDPGNYKEDGFRYTVPVGSYPNGVSPYGLLDMAGNVWEWCSDWYDKDYYKKSSKENPPGSESGSNRVVRGGSWDGDARVLRCTNRDYGRPSGRVGYLGFRLCQDNR